MKTAILAVLLAAAALTAPAATIQLNLSDPTPLVGQTFTADLVVVANTDEVLGFGLNYSLDNGNVSVVSALPDSFFGDDLGLGDPALSAFTYPGNSGVTVRLATFTLLANTLGASTFSVTSNLADLNQGVFFFNEATLDLTGNVQINVVTPEPSTFGLAALALAAAAALRRRAR